MKIIVVNGFLGSGKTTLMKRLIKIYQSYKIAVIVNEFGDTSIDGKILKDIELNVKEINNGSIFCTCKSDQFLDTLIDCYKENIDLILVESSGLSNPSSLSSIFSLLEGKVSETFEEILLITVIDAVNIHKIIDHLPLVRKQIEWANLILLNKIDIANEELISNAERMLGEINPFVNIIKTVKTEITLKDLQNLSFDYKDKVYSSNYKNLLLDSLSLSFEKIDIQNLKTALIKLNDRVYRIKGYVKTHRIDTVFNEQINLLEDNKQINRVVFLYNKSMITAEEILEVLKQNNVVIKKEL
jgi:G3E family GTPase